MGSRIQCFMIEPSDRAEITLRRYCYPGHGNDCKGPMGSHDALIHVGFTTEEPSHVEDSLNYPKDHPLWSKKCSDCDYVFQPEDQWQINCTRIYKAPDGKEYTLLFSTPQVGKAPAGAIWDAAWMPSKGPDGKSLMVMTPAGDWWVDGPSSNGPGWTRTGVPPNLTIRSSICIGNPVRYHGFLTNGFLEEC